MALAEDDHVIETFLADRTDKTLSVRVLPRRSRRGDDLGDPHRSNAMTECRTIRLVSVPQQIARCSVPGKGLGHLAGEPVLRGIWRDRKVDNSSAVDAQHNQGVEQPERRGGDYEHVNRRNVWKVVPQEASPGRGGGLGPPRHPPPDRSLANLDPEFEQLPVNARRTPQRVGVAHAADQITDFRTGSRPSGGRGVRSPWWQLLGARPPYCFWYPHFFRGPTVQQPVCMQASYRFWQIRCLPQYDRACEQVGASWADASWQEIATNPVLSAAARKAPKTTRVAINPPTHMGTGACTILPMTKGGILDHAS